jgi:hypothetical protein
VPADAAATEGSAELSTEVNSAVLTIEAALPIRNDQHVILFLKKKKKEKFFLFFSFFRKENRNVWWSCRDGRCVVTRTKRT